MGISRRIFNSLSSVVQAAFSWTRTKDETYNPVKVVRNTYRTTDFAETLTANEDLTRGLYFGEYPGMKLASALTLAPVKIPVFFMGVPAAKTDIENEQIDLILADIIENIYTDIQKVHIQRRREGTIWVFPQYDRELKKAKLEFISDQTVVSIKKSVETGNITEIITEENMRIQQGKYITVDVVRTRIFTKQRITVSYSGSTSGIEVESRTMRNVTGMLPVPFSFEADGGQVRGHSVFSRIIGDLKAYHDVDYQEAVILSKFQPKLAAGLKDVNQFALNNGYASAADFFENFDLTSTDMLLYDVGNNEQKPEILTAGDLIAPWSESQKRRFRKIVEGTGIPEIVWGLKTEGNMASVEENMSTLLMYVRGDQKECVHSWRMILKAMVRLEMMIRMIPNTGFDVEITWNDLDAISDQTKSEVFRNFAQGVKALVDSASLTDQQLYNIWKMNFPKATEQDFEEFKTGLWGMAKFKQYRDASLETAAGIDGTLPENPDEFGITP